MCRGALRLRRVATCSVTMTAEACVARELRQVLLVRDEREVAGTGALDAGDAADLDVAVAFQAAVQPIRKLSQLQNRTNLKSGIVNLKSDMYSQAGRDGDAIEKGRKPRQVQPRGDRGDARRPLRPRQIDQRRELGQTGIGLERPADHVQRLPRAAPRLQMTDEAEGEVVGDEVRAGNEEEHPRGRRTG